MLEQVQYELVAILNTENSEELEKSQKEIDDSLVKREVTVDSKEDWGKKPLFHLAKGQSEGHFKYFKFSTKPSSIDQINTDLRLNSGILKSMICRA